MLLCYLAYFATLSRLYSQFQLNSPLEACILSVMHRHFYMSFLCYPFQGNQALIAEGNEPPWKNIDSSHTASQKVGAAPEIIQSNLSDLPFVHAMVS
jgi:hypothetical protein